MALLWDVDNVNPGPDRRTAASPRSRSAATALGGGALGGGTGAPADVVAFRAYASETLARVDVDIELAGAEVVGCQSGPDQVDMTMGAHIDGFTRVDRRRRGPGRRDGCASSMTTIRDASDDSCDAAGDGSGPWEPFVVRGALDALLGDVADESDRTLISNAPRRGGCSSGGREAGVARGERVRSIRWTTRSNEDDEEEGEEEEAAGRRRTDRTRA